MHVLQERIAVATAIPVCSVGPCSPMTKAVSDLYRLLGGLERYSLCSLCSHAQYAQFGSSTTICTGAYQFDSNGQLLENGHKQTLM